MSERRTLWLLVLVIASQMLLLAVQVPGEGGESTMLGGGLMRIAAVLGNGVDAVADGVAATAMRWTTRRRLLAENERLRSENERLRREAVQRFGVERDLERLTAALDYVGSNATVARVADVVFFDREAWLKAIWLRVGEGGIEVHQPVVTADGLVGRVMLTSGPYAKVQLITDRAAAVGVMVERTRRQGVVRGAGDGLRLDFIPLQSDLVVGDRIVTAGIDGVYPRGIPVGTVVSVSPGSELFYEVTLEPAVAFSTVDHAYVMDPPPRPEVGEPAAPEDAG